MNALVCEMCGSNDVIKQEGCYVCQMCGTKYTVEEARKLMIEGTVDVSGSTVKIDHSELIEKHLQNARRAKQKEDWDETEKYYNLVEQHDPGNIEAIFYSSYGKAKKSLVEADLYKRQAAFKVLQNCVSIIDDNFDVSKEKEERAIIEQISSDIIGMAFSSFVYNQRKNGYGMEVSNDKSQTVTLFNELGREFMVSLEQIVKKVPEADQKIYYYKLAMKHAEFILQNGQLANPQSFVNVIMTYHQKMHEIDPNHVIPQPPSPPKKSGCYVATCVYGSYDCPEVWTLRRYRDYTLAATWYGLLFIHIYYLISPTIVKMFGNTQWFKKIWKGKLDKMVAKLRAEGVEDTPYEDREW